MKKFLIIAAVAAAFITACEDKGTTDTKADLTVAPEALSFAASENSPQNVVVTAKNVEWKVEVVAPADEWLSAEKTDSGLSVTVTDNPDPKNRSGEIKVRPVNNASVGTKTISVAQAGIDYSLTVDKNELVFSGEPDAPQEVTVTAGGGLTWTCSVEPIAREWVTAEVSGDKISVTVSNNPTYNERTAKITVKSDVDGVDNQIITVKQSPSSVDPYIKLSTTEVNCEYIEKEPIVITVDMFGTSYTTAFEVIDGNGVGWIGIGNNQDMTELSLTIARNFDPKPRTAKLIVTPTNTSLEDVVITINQEAGVSTLSTLTDDVDVTGKLNYSYAWVEADQSGADWQEYTSWIIEIRDKNVVKDFNTGKWGGTGSLILLKVFSDRLHGDEYHTFPDGRYNVDGEYDEDPEYGFLYHHPTVFPGTLSLWGYVDSWYVEFNDGESVAEAPLTGGYMETTHDGDVYTFDFHFTDDAGFNITGTFSKAFDEFIVQDNQ